MTKLCGFNLGGKGGSLTSTVEKSVLLLWLFIAYLIEDNIINTFVSTNAQECYVI